MTVALKNSCSEKKSRGMLRCCMNAGHWRTIWTTRLRSSCMDGVGSNDVVAHQSGELFCKHRRSKAGSRRASLSGLSKNCRRVSGRQPFGDCSSTHAFGQELCSISRSRSLLREYLGQRRGRSERRAGHVNSSSSRSKHWSLIWRSRMSCLQTLIS